MGNPYNPQTQILIRDWANAHHYELASLIAYLQRHGVDIEEVNNPYAQQLMHRHDSFSPIARVIPVTSSRWLDSFARMMGPVERQRSLHVTFHEQDSGAWAVPADDEGLDHADVRWWLLRPPSMVLDQPVKEVRASDFDWKPPIVVDTGLAACTCMDWWTSWMAPPSSMVSGVLALRNPASATGTLCQEAGVGASSIPMCP